MPVEILFIRMLVDFLRPPARHPRSSS